MATSDGREKPLAPFAYFKSELTAAATARPKWSRALRRQMRKTQANEEITLKYLTSIANAAKGRNS